MHLIITKGTDPIPFIFKQIIAILKKFANLVGGHTPSI